MHDLALGEVHVWIVEASAENVSWSTFLSPSERALSERMAPARRLNFRHRRGALRLLLSRYLRRPPHTIELALAKNGKPYLATQELAFNVAHSADLFVVALVRNCEIGVDVERIRSVNDAEAIAARFFTPEERRFLSGLGPQEFARTFLAMWTRKEAVLKAIGKGIVDGVQVSVPTESDLHGTEVVLESNSARGCLYLYDINAGPDYVASLALSSAGCRVVQRCLFPNRSAGESH